MSGELLRRSRNASRWRVEKNRIRWSSPAFSTVHGLSLATREPFICVNSALFPGLVFGDHGLRAGSGSEPSGGSWATRDGIPMPVRPDRLAVRAGHHQAPRSASWFGLPPADRSAVPCCAPSWVPAAVRSSSARHPAVTVAVWSANRGRSGELAMIRCSVHRSGRRRRPYRCPVVKVATRARELR